MQEILDIFMKIGLVGVWCDEDVAFIHLSFLFCILSCTTWIFYDIVSGELTVEGYRGLSINSLGWVRLRANYAYKS